jgi:Ca2+-binding RTX toxin-like protein
VRTRKARLALCVVAATALGGVFSSGAYGAFAFSNGNTITIPSGAPANTGPGNANPFPSSINVSGLLGPIGKATVTLTNLTHTWPDDIDILLSGPGGQAVILMSDAGTSLDINNVTLTFDDAAATAPPNENQIVSGTFMPSNYLGNDPLGVDTFTPGPAPSGSTLGVFTGTDPNGTWNLWVRDDENLDVGALSGWTLTLDGPVLAPGATPPPPPPPANPVTPPLLAGACANVQRGTPGNDNLIGSAAGDRLSGLGGADTISGRRGRDCVVGGPGADDLFGGRAGDRINGGPGRNTYAGGSGNDVINAVNNRTETVRCGAGRDKAIVDSSDGVTGCERVRRR